MTILRLHLKAYGPFTDRKIEFSSASTGLHVIHGPNEAGKTSALRAISAALFGIPTESKNRDQFAHSFSALRVGANLIHRNGSQVEFVRRPGKSKSLRDGNDDKALADDCLSAFLGSIDGDMFHSMFGIDHDRLRRGGAEMEKGEGKLGEILFTAGGVAELRQFQGKLDSRADELLTKKGQGGALAKASKELTAARKKLTELQLAITEWQSHHDRLQQLTASKNALDQQTRSTSNHLTRLQRLKSAFPSFAPWKQASAELKDLQHVVLLPDDFKERRINTQTQLRQAETTLADANERLKAIEEEINSIDVPTALLLEEKAIEALSLQLGSDLKARADRIDLVSALNNARKQAERLLMELGKGPELDAISDLHIPENRRVVIRDLASKHQGLFDKVQTTTNQLNKLKKAIEDLEDKLRSSAPVGDHSQLQQALNGAATLQDAPKQIESYEHTIALLTQEIDQKVRQLPHWKGTLDELLAISPPLDESIDQFEERFRKATSDLDALKKQCHSLTKEASTLRQQIIDIEDGQVISTEDDLTQARADRDRGWQLLIQHGLDSNRETASEIAEYLSSVPHALTLREAFFLKVTQADSLADTMRREADRVAAKAHLQSNLAEKEKQLTDLESDISTAEQTHSDLVIEWQALWTTHGMTSGTPREMKGWRREYQQIFDKVCDKREAALALEKQKARLKEITSNLVNALNQTTGEKIIVNMPFPDLLAESKAKLSQLIAEKQTRDLRQQKLEESNKELRDAEVDLTQATANLEAWEQRWKSEMECLGLDGQAHIQQANSVLETLSSLSQRAAEIEDLKQRIQGIDNDSASLQEAVLVVAKRLQQHVAINASAPEQAIETLKVELKLAKEKEVQRKALKQQLTEQTQRQSKAESSIKDCQAVIQTLLEQSGCQSEKDLPEHEAFSARRAELERSVSQLQNQLLAQAGQLSLEEFVAELNGTNPDSLPAQIAELQQELERNAAERDNLIRAIQTEELTLKTMNGSAAAAEQLEECESMVARLTEQTRELMVLRIAGTLLQAGMDRYREKTQSPILTRASELFAALTLNSFRSLKTDYNADGQPILVGIRESTDQVIHVESMSEGTRDQLYLALRIASLERWLHQNDPVPFIVDDILLTFDDERAIAALKVLSDLSRRTQVLFFTHHQHLVDLAERHLAKEHLHVHYLQQA